MNEEQTEVEAPAAAERPKLPLAELGFTLAGVVLMGLMILAIPDLREACSAAIQGDNDRVRSEIDSLGGWGPILIIVLCVIHAVVFYPAEIVNAAAGFAYGFFPALALTMLGWTLSALVCWLIGRSVARPLLDRWFGAERFQRLEERIERGGPGLLLAIRLIPILPFSLVSYAAGAARVPLWRYTWTTVVGFLPLTAIFVYFGTRLEGLSLTDPLVIGVAVALLALLGVSHLAMKWQTARSRRRAEAEPSSAS